MSGKERRKSKRMSGALTGGAPGTGGAGGAGRRNARGGVLVKGSDLQCLMDMFDSTGKGYISATDVVSIGRVFYPDMSDADGLETRRWRAEPARGD